MFAGFRPHTNLTIKIGTNGLTRSVSAITLLSLNTVEKNPLNKVHISEELDAVDLSFYIFAGISDLFCLDFTNDQNIELF